MRQVAPHWRAGPFHLWGRDYYVNMEYGPDNQPRVASVFTETSRGATLYLRHNSIREQKVIAAAGVLGTVKGGSDAA